jgi:putative hydrolase of the HAD superfamily
MPNQITIGFDADDTLWHNEDHFHAVEQEFASAMAPWTSSSEALTRLAETERRNLKIFGYGVKGFTISMIETALELSSGSIRSTVLQNLIEHGKDLHTRAPRLLPDVDAVLEALHGRYRLILITKGDLHHQEGKVGESGLADFFDHVSVVAEKDPRTYRRVLASAGVAANNFVMIGNSLKSDILPVVEIGGTGAHIPYEFTWVHERAEVSDSLRASQRFHELDSIASVPALIEELSAR